MDVEAATAALTFHWDYFSVTTGLIRSFTSPKAIDPYLLHLAESKVRGLEKVSCLADMKKLLDSVRKYTACMQDGNQFI